MNCKVVEDYKMYVIVREDLAFKFIQGSHALAEFAIVHNKSFLKWNNRTIIYLSVFNGIILKKCLNTIKKLPIELRSKAKYAVFYEPDLQSKLPTAICIYDPNKEFSFLQELSLATK